MSIRALTCCVTKRSPAAAPAREDAANATPNHLTMSTFRYAPSQILVHWLAAALIVFLLVTGTFVLAEIPNTPEKTGNFRIHMILGALAALLVVARVLLRRRHPQPPAVVAERRARLGHMGLNILVLLLAVSGSVLALQSGVADAVLGNGMLPESLDGWTLRKVHGLLSRLLMALIAVHVLAALYHQWIVRDGLLLRMRPGKTRSS